MSAKFQLFFASPEIRTIRKALEHSEIPKTWYPEFYSGGQHVKPKYVCLSVADLIHLRLIFNFYYDFLSSSADKDRQDLNDCLEIVSRVLEHLNCVLDHVDGIDKEGNS